MRRMGIQMLADATDGRGNAEGLIAKAKRKIVKDMVVTPRQVYWEAKRKMLKELAFANRIQCNHDPTSCERT